MDTICEDEVKKLIDKWICESLHSPEEVLKSFLRWINKRDYYIGELSDAEKYNLRCPYDLPPEL